MARSTRRSFRRSFRRSSLRSLLRSLLCGTILRSTPMSSPPSVEGVGALAVGEGVALGHMGERVEAKVAGTAQRVVHWEERLHVLPFVLE